MSQGCIWPTAGFCSPWFYSVPFKSRVTQHPLPAKHQCSTTPFPKLKRHHLVHHKYLGIICSILWINYLHPFVSIQESLMPICLLQAVGAQIVDINEKDGGSLLYYGWVTFDLWFIGKTLVSRCSFGRTERESSLWLMICPAEVNESERQSSLVKYSLLKSRAKLYWTDRWIDI